MSDERWEENQQLKQKLDWFLTETVAGKEYRPKEELEELQRENAKLKATLDKMKVCENCKNDVISMEANAICCDCKNKSKWELAE